ncbi:MAG: hypothetical protein U0271_24915 [Polyangiaceae bacterium]
MNVTKEPTSPESVRVLPVSVLTVGLDIATLSLVTSAVHAEGVSRLESVEALDAARLFVDVAGGPIIAIIDRSALVKALAFPDTVHVILLAGPSERGEPIAGVDEVLARPLRVDDLRSRLRIAARALSRSRTSPVDVLAQALAAERSGEVIVASGDESARVHVEQGRIVWVHRSQRAASVRQLLSRAGANIDEEGVRDLLEESRRTRQHFADVVVSWGLVEPAALREALRQHLAEELAIVLGWPSASAAFVADHRASSSAARVSFSGPELGLRARSLSRVSTLQDLPAVEIPSVGDRSVEAWLERVRAIEHVLGSALVDPKMGRVVGSLGFASSEMTIVWEMARAFTAMGEGAEEILATAHDKAFLVRAAPLLGGLVFVVRFDSARLSPAMARIVVSRVSPPRAEGAASSSERLE